MTDELQKPAEIDRLRQAILVGFAAFCAWLAYTALWSETGAAEEVGPWALIIMFGLLVVPAKRAKEDSFLSLVNSFMGARRGRGE